ncbi:hypothetical protein DFS34DRAFT_627682 [Phlyctochytrium arcticum]|nr:hypothetical protein DFS34DRAFT_627682 [Phlyctochytrium arcticum]
MLGKHSCAWVKGLCCLPVKWRKTFSRSRRSAVGENFAKPSSVKVRPEVARENPNIMSVKLLVVGVGWAGKYVLDFCGTQNVSCVGTTRDGRDGTIHFEFDPTSDDSSKFKALPQAETVLITFPLRGATVANRFTHHYNATHQGPSPQYILFGSTRAWTPSPGASSVWVDRTFSPDPSSDDRLDAEAALMKEGGCVLNLAGLWDHERNPKNWVKRVAATKEALAGKGSLHLIHGLDVAQAVVAVHQQFTPSQRWVLSDMRVYDWWDLASAWGETGKDASIGPSKGPQAGWVQELLAESNFRGLPRPVEHLQRAVDSREFWSHFGITPFHARI